MLCTVSDLIDAINSKLILANMLHCICINNNFTNKRDPSVNKLILIKNITDVGNYLSFILLKQLVLSCNLILYYLKL